MKSKLTQKQIQLFQMDGYLLVKDFLNADELTLWREAVSEAVEQRGGRKWPGTEIKTGEDDGINDDTDYYGKVFDQVLNLWQTNEKVKQLMLDKRLENMI